VPAIMVYKWDYIAPGASVGVFYTGYADTWAMVFSATVRPWRFAWEEEAYLPVAKIDLTQGEITRDVDDTIARTVWVRNRS